MVQAFEITTHKISLESIVSDDQNLIHFKGQILDSGLTLEEIRQTSLQELTAFLMEYVKLGSLAAKKAAQALQCRAGV
jgi:hypothetical protein